MKKVLKFLMILGFAAISFNACNKADNPVEPNNGEPTVTNPPHMLKITSIEITAFPTAKPNGEKWDYHIFSNSPTRRPDIYVELKSFGSSTFIYQSDVKEDALLENAYSYYSFSQPFSTGGLSLPYNLAYKSTYTIDLMDDDGLSADDWMGSLDITPEDLFNINSPDFVHKSITNGSTTFIINGQWVY